MTQDGAAVFVLVRQRGMGAGRGGVGEGIPRLPGGGGVGADISGVLRNRAAELEPLAVMLGALRANGTPGGMVYQYNCKTRALTRLPGVGGDDVLAALRHSAAVDEPGADILGGLPANESGVAVLYYNSGAVAQKEELGLVAMRGKEFRGVLVAEPGMEAGLGEGIGGVLVGHGVGVGVGVGEEFPGVLVHEPGMHVGRIEGIASVLPANGAATVQPYKTGTIPHLLGQGGGLVEDIRRVLPANHPAAVYYCKIPNSLREPSMGGGGRGEGLSSAPIPAKGPGSGASYYSGMSEHVVTFYDEALGGKATGDPVAAAGGSKFAGHVRRGLGVVGIAAASLAVTGLAAGGATTKAAGFGFFSALLCGVYLVNLRVLAA